MRACGWQLIGVRFGQGRLEKTSFLALAGSRRGGLRRWRSVLFCYATEKYQKSAPKGTNLRFAPSGLPHSRHGLVVACSGLIARTVPASRLSVTHALSPLGLAVKAVGNVFSKLSGTSFGVDRCVRADGS